MGKAYNSAKARSEQRAKELRETANSTNDPGESYKILSNLGAYKAGNDAAMATIAQASPGLGKVMSKPEKTIAAGPKDMSDQTYKVNLHGFANALLGNRQSAATAQPPPADPNDPAFAGLSKRCKEGAARVQEKLKAAKQGSDEAKYLAELKSALEKGEKNPAEAVRAVRGLSGTELAAVLSQLGVGAGTDKNAR